MHNRRLLPKIIKRLIIESVTFIVKLIIDGCNFLFFIDAMGGPKLKRKKKPTQLIIRERQ